MNHPNKFKAISAARKALENNYLIDPSNANLQGVLGSEGIFYQEKVLISALGFLQRSKRIGTVIISNTITHPHRKRFVIAHELGHWYLHEDIPIFKCTPEFFNQWNHRTIAIEQEANIFASEFLMPTIPFRSFCEGKSFSKDLIIGLSKRFNVSVTAAALRFASVGSEDIMIAYSTRRVVQWSCASDDFPWRFYDSQFNIPADSITDEAYDEDASDERAEIDALEWFKKEHSNLNDLYLYEEVITMPSYNSCLTFLYQSEKNF